MLKAVNKLLTVGKKKETKKDEAPVKTEKDVLEEILAELKKKNK